MMYAEAAYFDGAHVKHIADYYEEQRLKRLSRCATLAARRGGSQIRTTAPLSAKNNRNH